MQATTLPLFLGRRVLLPGALMALQVYEERYRLMMEQLEDELVGVTMIRLPEEGGPEWSSVGTVGRVVGRHDLPHGALRLMVEGERRFEVVEFLSDDPYPLALVEFVAEPPPDRLARSLRTAVEERLGRYLELLAESGERTEPDLSLSTDPALASYEVASAMRVSQPERQELLELPTAGARLERELALLGREIALLEHVLGTGRIGQAGRRGR